MSKTSQMSKKDKNRYRGCFDTLKGIFADFTLSRQQKQKQTYLDIKVHRVQMSN